MSTSGKGGERSESAGDALKLVEQAGRPKVQKNELRSVQGLRLAAQLLSLAVNIWIGVQFYLWVGYIRSGGQGTAFARPPGVEGWLPIGSLVSLRYWWETGVVNHVHPSGLVILLVVLLTAFLFKKGFCSWVCPVGLISESLGDLSQRLFKGRLAPPRWLDYPLRSLKYILLGFFLWAVLWSMSPADIKSFVYSDYNVVSDILMLRFFTDASRVTVGVILGLLALSLVVRGFWCRYLCPYGALLGLIGLVSPTRIRRSASTCIDCGKCARVCPSFIKVDRVSEVVSDECTGCLACVDSCPVKATLEVKAVSKRRTISPVKWAAVLLIVFWGSLVAVKVWGPWQNGISDQQYMERVEGAFEGRYAHP